MTTQEPMATGLRTARRDEMPALAVALTTYMEEKVAAQGGVPTFFDNLMRVKLAPLTTAAAAGDHAAPVSEPVADALVRFSRMLARDRLADPLERMVESNDWSRLPWELTGIQMAASQGVRDCVRWRGLPLFKTVFDVALYPMIVGEVEPGTIIELGSGTGASALWLADLVRAGRLDAHVYSVDIVPIALREPGVTFLTGDCGDIASLFPPAVLAAMPHPWLLVEDMHVATLDVLRYFAASARAGDYFVVEDSSVKSAALRAFHEERRGEFRVDTRYTDFFGRNATCSADSILVKIR